MDTTAAIIQYTSGKTSYLQDNVEGVTTEISEARENGLDFIRLYDTNGKPIWIDPNQIEAVYEYIPNKRGTKN